MMAKRIRWSDEDKYFGPLTYAPDKYGNFSIVLGSGDGDEHPGCRLRISAFGHTGILALPAIISPWLIKHMAPSWDAATIERPGRNWYWEKHEREYGFSVAEGFLQVFLGRSTHDSSTEQRWSTFLPWTQWRHVRHSYHGLDGNHFWTFPPIVGRILAGATTMEAGMTWDEFFAVQKSCPTRSFCFTDFDGESLTAKTRIEERQWEFGIGWFKWLSWFHAPKVKRSLDIEFSGETGKGKGSWKGGTIGHSIDMVSGELHEAAFRRYCTEHDMQFVEGPVAHG